MADTFQGGIPLGGPGVPGGASNQYGPTAGLPASYGQTNNLLGVSGPGQGNQNPAAAGSQSGSGYIPGVNVPNYGGSPPNTVPSTANTAVNYAKGPGGTGFEDPTSPQLQGNWSNWLNGQVGQGLPAFNLPTNLPTGGQTQAGAVNAPLDQTLQDLMGYFQTGKSSDPGLTALGQLAQGTSAIPQWQADIKAMQPQIAQNQANLKEQFASTGALGSSEYGAAESNFAQGTASSQNALLAQIQQQNQQTQLSAASGLAGLQSQLGQYLQGLDQQSIQNMMQEYMTTLPQNSPILQYLYGQSNSYAPIFNRQTGASTAQNIASGLGIAGAAGGALSAAGAGAGGGSAAAIVAALAAL